MLTDPRTNEPKYIGQTKQELRIRLNRHVVDRTKSSTYKNNWIIQLKKQGLRPNIELIETVPVNEWEFWETYWISQFKQWGFRLTNLTPGGEGCIGGSGCKGYRHTKEARKKISNANSKPRSREWVENQSKSRYKPVLMYSKQGKFLKEWESATSAAVALGNIDMKKNISACARGNKKTAYGCVWKFKT